MQSDILVKLLNQTWSSPVFGDSFKDVNLELVYRQIKQISLNVNNNLTKIIRQGMPELSSKEVANIVEQIVPKTVSFCPALAAGEISDATKLQNVATAIGIMYWGDQTLDRGDEAMFYAIKMLKDSTLGFPRDLEKLIKARHESLKQIETYIKLFAKPEDVAIVLDCFLDQVLVNEVRLQELSREYLNTEHKSDFISKNASEICKLMVVDAGLPSVSTSLYAIYRHSNPSLVSVDELYSNKQIATLLQICNSVVRAADEYGDWQMDSGVDKKWGIFVINLFNQANNDLIQEFLKLADIRPEHKIVDAFLNFNQDRKHHGEFLMQVFFDHIKNFIKNLPEQTKIQHNLYIQLCKRVLEIGKVNEMGDIALSGSEKE